MFNLLGTKYNNRKITENDVGIIAPYRQQVQALKELRFQKILIGTADAFQGSEKPIIIISTVRSGSDDIGFLKDPRVKISIFFILYCIKLFIYYLRSFFLSIH